MRIVRYVDVLGRRDCAWLTKVVLVGDGRGRGRGEKDAWGARAHGDAGRRKLKIVRLGAWMMDDGSVPGYVATLPYR